MQTQFTFKRPREQDEIQGPPSKLPRLQQSMNVQPYQNNAASPTMFSVYFQAMQYIEAIHQSEGVDQKISALLIGIPSLYYHAADRNTSINDVESSLRHIKNITSDLFKENESLSIQYQYVMEKLIGLAQTILNLKIQDDIFSIAEFLLQTRFYNNRKSAIMI